MREPERTRFCVIGGDGAIGSALEKSLRSRGVPAVFSTRRGVVDPMTQFPIDLRGDLTEVAIPECDVLILAAAMTRLSDCRSDPEAARRVNVDAQVHLASRAARNGAFVVFLSTNQVFDGTRSHVAPEEPPSPRSSYGKLKAEAESKLLQLGGEVAVIRLTKVIGRHLPLFESWRRELLCGNVINAFEDLVMAPIAMPKVVAGIEVAGLQRMQGMWHLSGREDLSYFEAGRYLARRLNVDEALVCAASAAAAGVPEDERPAHTAMALAGIEAITGIRIENAETELDIGLGFT